GTKGEAAHFISRSQALTKLQVSLAAFRRLCILKGIYPRQPKKFGTKQRTYYVRKDIMFLLHDPMLARMREMTAFRKKISKIANRGDRSTAELWKKEAPQLTLDHVIRERYPSFVDALRDVDDALSMVFLFAKLPTTTFIAKEHILACQRLAQEWTHYISAKRALRKVFLSVKGIYYQAEVYGQTITWLSPFPFVQHMPADVDYRVMRTFLQLYETVLGFVNYKLFADQGWAYPPKFDETMVRNGATPLSSLIVRSAENRDADADVDADAEMNDEAASGDVPEDEEEALGAVPDLAGLPQPFKEPARPEELVPSLSTWAEDLKLRNDRRNLFGNLVFFLSRETFRDSLEFVIKSFGGRVGWESLDDKDASISPDDDRITHMVVDRPLVASIAATRRTDREYIQPQWIYDSVNAGTLLPTTDYLQGATLPPHLSPFVTYRAGDYVPEAAMTEEQRQELRASREALAQEAKTRQAARAQEEDDAERVKSLLAEKAGVAYDETELEPNAAAAAEEQLAKIEAQAAGLTRAQHIQDTHLSTQSAHLPSKKEKARLERIMMSSKNKYVQKQINMATERKDKFKKRLERRRDLASNRS
ncbi:hypothetical protein CXG81DRAFT_9149, partial [Caulochytrium protostelioides]